MKDPKAFGENRRALSKQTLIKEVVIMSRRGQLAGWRSVQRDAVRRLATREHKTSEKLYRANKSGMAPQMARPVIAMMMTEIEQAPKKTRRGRRGRK